MGASMKLSIRSVGVWGCANIRSWKPREPGVITEDVLVDVGKANAGSADTFVVRLATPDGLKTLEERDSILATRPILVVRRYDWAVVETWLENVVSSCESDSWSECVANLRLHFTWEFANIQADAQRHLLSKPSAQLIVRSARFDGTSVRSWRQDDGGSLVRDVQLTIGEKGGKSSEQFAIRVASPDGLAALGGEGILAARPLLVVSRFEGDLFWSWLEETVKSCEAESVASSIQKLREFFAWEHEPKVR